jgi:hypothetical protein
MNADRLVDLGTLVTAIVGSALASYRSLLARISKVEERAAIHEGALRAAGILTDRRRGR